MFTYPITPTFKAFLDFDPGAEGDELVLSAGSGDDPEPAHPDICRWEIDPRVTRKNLVSLENDDEVSRYLEQIRSGFMALQRLQTRATSWSVCRIREEIRGSKGKNRAH